MDKLAAAIWCLSKVNIFRELPRALIAKLAEIATEREFAKGELIFGPYDREERIFVIREGEVEIYQLSPEGKKVILDILVPGNMFGNSSFSSEPFVELNDFAVSRTRVVLCTFRKSDFMGVLKTMPELALGLINEISTKLYEADSRIRDLALSDATTRLIGELLRFGRKVGREMNDKIVFGTKITHEELAGMTGVTRETVTRVLKKLRQEQIIGFDESRHIVIDKKKVREVLKT